MCSSYLCFLTLIDVFYNFVLLLKQEEADAVEGSLDGKGSTPLPILCIEDGMVILRFSEIFAIHEPLKKDEKREHRYSILKGRSSCFGFHRSGLVFLSYYLLNFF